MSAGDKEKRKLQSNFTSFAHKVAPTKFLIYLCYSQLKMNYFNVQQFSRVKSRSQLSFVFRIAFYSQGKAFDKFLFRFIWSNTCKTKSARLSRFLWRFSEDLRSFNFLPCLADRQKNIFTEIIRPCTLTACGTREKAPQWHIF